MFACPGLCSLVVLWCVAFIAPRASDSGGSSPRAFLGVSVGRISAPEDAYARAEGYPGALMSQHPLKAGRRREKDHLSCQKPTCWAHVVLFQVKPAFSLLESPVGGLEGPKHGCCCPVAMLAVGNQKGSYLKEILWMEKILHHRSETLEW